jgi:rhodanese-related sulfurtransferase
VKKIILNLKNNHKKFLTWKPSIHSLDIRPDDHFEHSHLIGSLRIKCCIDSGLVDTGNLRIALEKFTSDINRELSKDEDQEIPFLTLVGMREPDSTLFTCANELIRMGFVGVSAVEGGFESIVQEVQAIGSEDLLLWR